MLRIAPPSGILTVNGTVGTTPVSVSSSTAYGLSSENAGGPSFQISIFDFLPDGGNVVFLRWDQLPPIGAATYVLGGTLGFAGFGTLGASAAATAGSVTIVSFNANHVSGSYLLTLDGGGTITGTFDVDILIQN
jgi:hypothetical protein